MNPQPFGYYTLINRINVGGMAEVFKACYYQEDGKPAFAAIKRILPHLAQDHSFVEMFLSEATTSGRLQHPGIAQIIEQGEEQGEYFISMEYISGRDLLYLRHHLRERGMLLSPALSAYVISCVADALDYAHALCDDQGRHLEIIHRDVSPQNILISYDGGVKLIDFGIAKAKDRGYEATKAGVLKGKFGYMAPEQIRGKTPDHRLDVFSLGVVLYELLTNQRLFLGENDLETLEMVREARVSAPSLVNKWVSPELDRITLRALQAEPDQRYQRAGELAHDLRTFIQQNAPSTNQSTLKSWMYQEFSNYIAHEQAQESHILDQLNYQEDQGVPEDYTTETLSQSINQLLAPEPAQGEHANEDTQPPGQAPLKTEAYQAIALAPFQSDDVPTRPVSSEVFKDLKNKGYELPSDDYMHVMEIDPKTDNEIPKRTHALETHEVEELFDGSFEDISMSEDGVGLHAENTPTDQLIRTPSKHKLNQAKQPGLLSSAALSSMEHLDPLEATAPITAEEREALFAYGQQHLSQVRDNQASPFSTMPLVSGQGQGSPFAHAEVDNDPDDNIPTSPLQRSGPEEPQTLPENEYIDELISEGEDALNQIRNEVKERNESTTGPAYEAFDENLTPSPGSLKARLPLYLGIAAALCLAVGLSVVAPMILSSPLSLSVRVMPRDQLTVTQQPEGSEPTQMGPLKAPIKLSLSAPTRLRIERDGFEPYEVTLDPDSEELSSGELRVELVQLFPEVDLNVSSVPPGAMVWVNEQQLSKQTPIKGLKVTPSQLGEVKVRVQARGVPAQEQVQSVTKGGRSPQALRFIFMLQ